MRETEDCNTQTMGEQASRRNIGRRKLIMLSLQALLSLLEEGGWKTFYRLLSGEDRKKRVTRSDGQMRDRKRNKILSKFQREEDLIRKRERKRKIQRVKRAGESEREEN